MNYWHECIVEAFDEIGIEATEEQIKYIVEAVNGAHENYGLATGRECIPNPLKEENVRLERELKLERQKIYCKYCNGTGRITSLGPSHSSNSQCLKCMGRGRI